jgi:uncharacterized membrane protein
MQIETSKTLGAVGALLMFIGIIPYINYFGVIELIGLILVMVALNSLAGLYKEGGIFNNALYGLIIGIVGGVVAVATVIFWVLSALTDFMYALFPDWNGDWAALSGLTPDPSNLTLDNITPILTGIFVGFIILWITAIIATYFIRRSLRTLSAKSGVGLFSTAGLLLLIGGVLIILFGIGLILIWISALLLAIAFFSIKTQPTQPQASPQEPPPTT